MPLTASSKFMTDNPTTKHLPNYQEFLFDGTVTLYVGRYNKRMEIHKKLLASISPELDKHVHNDMKEGIEGIIRLPDEEERVLTLFTEWAYTGDYAHNDRTLLPNIPNLIEPNQDPWPSLYKHLQLCVFSDKFNIPTLKHLAESKFHTALNIIEPTSKGDATGLFMVIDYAYDNLPSSDPILQFLAQYASWKLELLRETSEFNYLISTHPAFLKELFVNLKGLKNKPIVPQKHLMDDGERWM